MISPAVSLEHVQVLLFDVMGTVVDVDGTARRTAVDALASNLTPDRATSMVEDWNREIGTRIDAVVDGAAPWSAHADLRAEALRAALSTAVATEPSAKALSQLDGVVQHADPWPEAPAALQRLRASSVVVALSNAGVGELAALSQHGGLAWHALVSAEAAQSFKPAPIVYQTAIRLLGFPPAQMLMVAAHPWDLRAAAQLGMATAFIARPDAETPRSDDHFSVQVEDLNALADLLDQASHS